MIGLGVIIHSLGGNEETVNTHRSAVGKVIRSVSLSDDTLSLRFTDGTGIIAYDDGQSCCESRYMTTDDDLTAFVGATFVGMELRDGPETTNEYGDPHEIQFLLVNTSRGVFTMVTHNEHNGYYGGFWVVVKPLEDN